MGSLFGGGGSKTSVVDPYPQGMRQLYQQLSDWLGPMIGQGVSPYPGQMVPGVSPLQQQGFGAAGGLGPLGQAGQQYFGDVLGRADPAAPGRYEQMAAGGLGDIFKPFDPGMAREALEPARQFGMDIFKQDVVPYIMERYGPAMGAKEGGAMWREMGRAGGQLAGGLGAELGRSIFPAWQSHLGRQQAGVGQAIGMAQLPGQVLGQAGQIGGMGADLLGQLMNIGGQQRGISGEQLGEEQYKWQFQQPWASPYQSWLQTALGQPPSEVVVEGQGPGMSALLGPLGSFLGTEAGAGGLMDLAKWAAPMAAMALPFI